ncbi:MAG: hypothetical protein ACREDO_13105 [Methyloceanibacter sp.]
MDYRLIVMIVAGLALGSFASLQTMAATETTMASCGEGSSEEQVACLSKKVADLEAKFAELAKESLKWNDRVTLVNEDMRIFPRCLENPGPDTRQLTDVFASSCAKIPAQAWMVRKAYH